MSALPAWLGRLSPLARDLAGDYGRAELRADLIAGLTTAVMLIPQGMAYAMLAGLPPVTGLYASLAPLLLYALLGSSRQLAVGPVAMDSILVATGVGAIATVGTDTYLAYAVLLAAMVGVFQVAMGLARLGFVANLLSVPVIGGFTSAAALIIGVSQLQHLLGVPLGRSQHVHEVLIEAGRRAAEIEPITLGLGVAAILALVLLKRIRPTFPRALAVVVGTTLAVFGLGLHERSVAIVGEVPAGLPGLALPSFQVDALASLWPTALAIALVGYMEAISVAKTYASKAKTKLDPNRELVALGSANLAAGLVRGYPVTGGFSRTAVNASAGAKTGLAGLITAAVVGLTLLLLTPLFFYVPKAVLAAIIMVAVFGLIDLEQARRLWAINRRDFSLALLTFAATLALGIQQGILVGVGASLLWFVIRSSQPHVAVLGRLPGTTLYRNVERFEEAEIHESTLALRFDAPLFFGNVAFLRDTLERLIAERSPSVIVLDTSAVNELDASADDALREIDADLEAREIRLVLAGLRGPVRDAMRRSGLWERFEGRRTETVHEAMPPQAT